VIKAGYKASRTSAALIYAPHEQRECLTGIFIYHGQHFIRPVITQLVVSEIDGTHMIRPIGAHT